MNRQQQNKAFIVEYYSVMSGAKKKTEALCDQFMEDDKLKEHILFFDSIFPGYEVFAEEMTAEGDRVIVLARLLGVHKGAFTGIPPTHKQVNFLFAIGYTIRERKIVDHWLVADQATLMEQIGALANPSEQMT